MKFTLKFSEYSFGCALARNGRLYLRGRDVATYLGYQPSYFATRYCRRSLRDVLETSTASSELSLREKYIWYPKTIGLRKKSRTPKDWSSFKNLVWTKVTVRNLPQTDPVVVAHDGGSVSFRAWLQIQSLRRRPQHPSPPQQDSSAPPAEHGHRSTSPDPCIYSYSPQSPVYVPPSSPKNDPFLQQQQDLDASPSCLSSSCRCSEQPKQETPQPEQSLSSVQTPPQQQHMSPADNSVFITGPANLKIYHNGRLL